MTEKHTHTPDLDVAIRLTDARVLAFILGLIYLSAKLVIHPIANMILVWQSQMPLIPFPPLETLDVLLLVAMPMGLSAFNTLLNKVPTK